MNIIAQRFGLNLLAALRFVYAILAAASQNKTDDAKYYHCDADPLRSWQAKENSADLICAEILKAETFNAVQNGIKEQNTPCLQPFAKS